MTWLLLAMSLSLSVFAAPVAVNDTIYAFEDQPISFNVLDNDYDLDGNSLFALLLNEEEGVYVTLNSDGFASVTFQTNFNGTRHFTYQVCNSLSGVNCSIGYVTIIIAPVNDPPSTCIVPNIKMCKNGSYTGDVVVNSYIDLNEGQTTYLTDFSTNVGTVEFDSLGNVTFIPPQGYVGSITITYTVCDTGEPSQCSTYNNSTWVVVTDLITVSTNQLINPTCLGSSNGRIVVSATGGMGYLMYSWNTGGTNTYYNNLPVGTYSLTVHDHGNCATDTTVYYTLSAPQILSYLAENISVDCNTDLASFNIIPQNGTTPYAISWFDGTDSDSRSVPVDQTWSLSITDNIGCHLDTSIFVSGESCTLNNFIFPEGFSPNYDGINDLFFIQNFPPSFTGKLVIWNLNGRTVYERDNYQNDWSGIDDLTGERVPNSTYFYIFEDVKTGDKKEGTITIQY
jgi:gliding motility-associated-like protein